MKTYQQFQGDSLAAHATLIQWYFENNHVAQAVLLAREWLVSYHLHIQERDWRDKKERTDMERQLGENQKQLALWSKTTGVRNDLAHCGFGRAEGQVLSASRLRQSAAEIVQQISEMAQLV